MNIACVVMLSVLVCVLAWWD